MSALVDPQEFYVRVTRAETYADRARVMRELLRELGYAKGIDAIEYVERDEDGMEARDGRDAQDDD